MILNLPTIEKENTIGLSKLADDAQQHVASLNTLGVSLNPELVVHVLETKLPRLTLEKWESTLDRDEYPTIDQMYEFLYKTAVCASKRERSTLIEPDKAKREPPMKRKRLSTNQTFISNTLHNCPVCKTKRHPLYLCDKFKQLAIPKRIESVKHAKLCYNCLRSHRDKPCKYSSCTICQKRHNTLLHLDKHVNPVKPNAPNAVPKDIKTD